MEAFGDIVLFHLRRLKISRNELARRSGLGRGYLTHLINRDLRPNGLEYHPTRVTVEKIAEGLGLSFESPEGIRLFASLGYIPPDSTATYDPQLLRLNKLLNYTERKDPDPVTYSRQVLNTLIELLEKADDGAEAA